MQLLIHRLTGKMTRTTALATPRTKPLSLQQLDYTDKGKRTEADKKQLRVEYGLGEHHSPLFRVSADLYRYEVYL